MPTIQTHNPLSDSPKPALLPANSDAIPSRALVVENLELRQSQISSVLHMFSQEDLFKLALVISPSVRDLLHTDPVRLRDLFWIELRAALSEDPILLRMTLGYRAGDLDSSENLSLVHRLKNLNPSAAQSLGWVIGFLGDGGLIETLQSHGGSGSLSYGTPFWKVRCDQRNDGRSQQLEVPIQEALKHPVDVHA